MSVIKPLPIDLESQEKIEALAKYIAECQDRLIKAMAVDVRHLEKWEGTDSARVAAEKEKIACRLLR